MVPALEHRPHPSLEGIEAELKSCCPAVVFCDLVVTVARREVHEAAVFLGLMSLL